MTGRPIRVYADTSVYGGVFDDEYSKASRLFFDDVIAGRLRLVISPLVGDELKDAPEPVRALLVSVRGGAEIADVTEETVRLQQAYLAARIVGAQWETDALHVAIATVSTSAAIVSWNFKHIVNFARIPLYNGINLSNGYSAIAVHTPQEVILHEDEDL
jgi:hypothetical protein